MVAVSYLCDGLPDALGVESAAVLSLLDGLATALDEAAVFDRLSLADARKVAGAVAWVAILGPEAGRPPSEVADALLTRAVRAKTGLDGRRWRDSTRVSTAFVKASDVLRRL